MDSEAVETRCGSGYSVFGGVARPLFAAPRIWPKREPRRLVFVGLFRRCCRGHGLNVAFAREQFAPPYRDAVKCCNFESASQ